MKVKETIVYKYRWALGAGIVVGLILLFVFGKVKLPGNNAEKIKQLEQRNAELEAKNKEDSVYRVWQKEITDSLEILLANRQDRIIYNTKYYERIRYLYRDSSAAAVERYLFTRYREDSLAGR